MSKKRKLVLKPWVRNTITVILLGVIAFSAFNIIKIKLDESNTIKLQNEFKLPSIKEDDKDAQQETYTDRFNRLKELNGDFLGWISFESGLLDLPFLKTTDNDFYLTKNLKKEYSSHGTVFQDYLQNLDGRNITLYGHYVYNNKDLMFTPLVELRDQANYEKNKIFSLFLENKELKYQVVGIIKYSLNDLPLYQVGDLTDEEFRDFKAYVNKNRLYDAGIQIEDDDKLASLQTCVRNEDDTRWLVIGKLIEEKEIK